MSHPTKTRLGLVGGLLAAVSSLAAGVTLALAGSAAAATGAPANTAPPTISGTPQQGQTLTGHAGGWTGAQPTRFGNQWQRCNSGGTACAPISGATGKRYTVARRDIGHTIRLKETATNAAGSSSSSSAATAVVTAAPASAPANTSPPKVSGTPQEGQTLNGATGTWSGTKPMQFSYKWQRCDASGGSCSRIVGATGGSHKLSSADVGNTIRLTVTATNSAGTSSSTSVPSAVVASLQSTAPVNTSPAGISGTSKQGQTLTAHPGSWQGANPISDSYQWLRCDANGGSCVDIPGATSQTYTPVSNDVGQTLRVRVTATNSSGTGKSTSVPTGVVSSSGRTTSANGCPISSGPVSVNAVVAPSRLVINRFQSSPSVMRRSGHQLAVRFHITDTCGQAVRGALVYSTAVPWSQFNVPAEQPTDASGNAILYFHTLAGFPASRSQRSLVFFVRARRAGDPILAGISGERLISLPFNPNA
jgi:hypothetical protein